MTFRISHLSSALSGIIHISKSCNCRLESCTSKTLQHQFRIKEVSCLQYRLGPRHHLSTTERNSALKDSMAANKQSPLLTEVKGESGRLYKIEKVLQDKGFQLGRVFLAREGNERYILKEIPRYNFDVRLGIYQKLERNIHVRGLEDTAQEHSIFIFKYLNENLLGLIQRDLPVTMVKLVLKQALQGLAAMHARDIVHNDVKPNNILIEVSGPPQSPVIEQTVITDLEDSAYCPPPGDLMGAQLGNWMWRSPEAHAEGPMNKPSDVFAFAVVCIYAMTKRVIFGVLQEELAEGEEILAIVLERQLSYFCDPDAFNGFVEYLYSARPENPWIEVFTVIRSGFSAENPRKPFALWQEEPPFDNCFRDLIVKMTNFDPRQRITAQEAVDHRWFQDV